MTQNWTALQGQVVDGLFSLGECVGGTVQHAVFLTSGIQPGSDSGAIKLIRVRDGSPEDQLSVWEQVSKLSHPNLMRLHRWGTCNIGAEPMVYVVSDRADEVLANVLAERALTEQETKEMLAPVVDVLAYLHHEGYVHGRVKPSNMFAVDDQLRISADPITTAGIIPSGSVEPSPYDAPELMSAGKTPAADVWSLGWTIVEVLTQQRPGRSSVTARLPSPFEEIVRRCLEPEAARRWSMQQIAARLRGEGTETAERGAGLRRYAIPAAVAALAAALWIGPKIGGQAPAEPQPPASPPVSNSRAVPMGQAENRPSPMPAATTPPAAAPARDPEPLLPPPAPVTPSARSSKENVELPAVPAKALRTVRGSFRVAIGVVLDENGAVTRAAVESRGPSPYFADLSLDAARQSKFPVGEDGRRRLIQYEFTRRGARVVAVR